MALGAGSAEHATRFFVLARSMRVDVRTFPEFAATSRLALDTRVVVGLWLLAFLLIQLPLLAIASRFILLDGDTSWHIVAGRQIWETTSFPHVDEFSYTFYGQPWIAKEWLSQLILFGAFELASWRGVVLVTTLAIAAAYSLLFIVLARELRVTVAFGISLLAIILSMGHFLARPHIFSFPLIVIWFAGLVSAVERRTTPSLWLLLVMVLWANLHAGFTLGLGIAGLLACEAILSADRKERRGIALDWGGFLLAALLATFVTPYGYEPLLITFKLYGTQPVHYIREWAPFNANDDPFLEAVTLSLIFLSLAFGVRIRFWRLLILIALVHLTFKHVRMAPMFAIIAPIVIANSLTQQFSFLRLSSQMASDPRFFNFVARLANPKVIAGLALAITVASGLYVVRDPIQPKQHIELQSSVDFLERAGLTNRLYHSYGFAGYLMYRGIKVFVDSRIDQLFTDGFFENSAKAAKGTGASIVSLLDRYAINTALVAQGSTEASQLQNDPNWSQVYSDATAIILTRRTTEPSARVK
jgi:hypothetical protein